MQIWNIYVFGLSAVTRVRKSYAYTLLFENKLLFPPAQPK